MEENAFVQKVLSDLRFAASAYSGLRQRPKAFKQLVAYPEVTRRIIKDPVFFAVLMCGDSWLVNAPDHQKLLRDQSPTASCRVRKGLGKKPRFQPQKPLAPLHETQRGKPHHKQHPTPKHDHVRLLLLHNQSEPAHARNASAPRNNTHSHQTQTPVRRQTHSLALLPRQTQRLPPRLDLPWTKQA